MDDDHRTDDTHPSTSENIEETPGVDRDFRPPLRDYTGQDWHWFEQDTSEAEAGEE
jgi:hypothetical protein